MCDGPSTLPWPPSHSLCSSLMTVQVLNHAPLLYHRAFAPAKLITPNALPQPFPSPSLESQYKRPLLKTILITEVKGPFLPPIKLLLQTPCPLPTEHLSPWVIMCLSDCLFVYYLERTYVVFVFPPPFFFGGSSGCPCTWFCLACQSPTQPPRLSHMHTESRKGSLTQAWMTKPSML